MKSILKEYGLALGVTAIGFLIMGSSAVMSIGKVSAFPPSIYGEGKFLFGNIGSIQNDKDGKPAWLLSGHWKSNLINMSENDKANSSAFSTSFEMVMLDGKNAHTHAITNFILKGKSTEGNSTLVFNGTSSASLRNGLVQNVPTTIKFMGNKVVSIWIDPSMVDNHFGNTPIYGTIMKPDAGFDRANSNSNSSR
jgi:hypothetical protein